MSTSTLSDASARGLRPAGPRRFSRTLGLLAVLLGIGFGRPAPAEAQITVFGAPGHWCTFNRPCNWTAHAGIAFGTTWALHKVDVPLPLAAGIGGGLFLGKEIRDHVKWGDFWTFDSLVDLGTGVAGAALAYWVLKPDDETPVPMPVVGRDGTVGLQLRLAF